MPWEFFLGNAAHRLIAYVYGVNHPQNDIYYNTKTLLEILRQEEVGDPDRLLQNERNLRPDITDVTFRSVFEIKPWTEGGLQDGRLKLSIYLAALHRAVLRGKPFSGGTAFHGENLIRFAQGQHIWRLEWQTTEAGVVQYRWTRSRGRFDSFEAAYQAGQWVELTEQEMQQYGGWVAQAVEGMVIRREALANFRGVVGVAIDIIGVGTMGLLYGAIFGRTGTLSGSKQPPVQGGGQIVPFPLRSPPPAPRAPLPKASGM